MAHACMMKNAPNLTTHASITPRSDLATLSAARQFASV